MSTRRASARRIQDKVSGWAEKVDWVSKGTNGFKLKVDVVQPSVLVVSQMNYPGWKAYIDGKSTPVLRADYALSAIRVGPGSHNVHFSFEPLSFKIGLLLSVIAALISLIIIFQDWRNLTRQNFNSTLTT